MGGKESCVVLLGEENRDEVQTELISYSRMSQEERKWQWQNEREERGEKWGTTTSRHSLN